MDRATAPHHDRRRPGGVARQYGCGSWRRVRAIQPARRGRDRLRLCTVVGGDGGEERGVVSYKKKDFPTHNVRRFLEPGPIVLVRSAHKGETNIMTMGWHMVMEFSPSLVGCLISSGNHSFEIIKASRQCVINLPTEDLATTVVKIGNTSGRDIDKFERFGLTPKP